MMNATGLATQYQLPIREVIQGGQVDKAAFVDTGEAVSSTPPRPTGPVQSMDCCPAKRSPNDCLAESCREGQENRQLQTSGLGLPGNVTGVNLSHRLWTESPTAAGEQLPLPLPETKNFKPSGSGESPLANLEDWLTTRILSPASLARRETNTMPQWAAPAGITCGSSTRRIPVRWLIR